MGAHHHHHPKNSNLRTAFFLNLFFTVFELIGGLYLNSVAIISDAIHDLGDSLSLGTAWFLQVKSKKAADKNFSFGYARFSLMGAFINCVVLIVGSVFVIQHAYERLISPELSNAPGMIAFALVGISVNGYAAWKMASGKSMNEKVISWHLIEDVLGWIAILVVAIVLLFYDNPYLDPALSLMITAYILWNVIIRLKETIYLFLQGVPPEIDIHKIEQELTSVHNVQSVHHIHIWSLEGEQHVFSGHFRLENITSLNEIVIVKEAIKKMLHKYHFRHITIETELEDESCEV